MISLIMTFSCLLSALYLRPRSVRMTLTLLREEVMRHILDSSKVQDLRRVVRLPFEVLRTRPTLKLSAREFIMASLASLVDSACVTVQNMSPSRPRGDKSGSKDHQSGDTAGETYNE